MFWKPALGALGMVQDKNMAASVDAGRRDAIVATRIEDFMMKEDVGVSKKAVEGRDLDCLKEERPV